VGSFAGSWADAEIGGGCFLRAQSPLVFGRERASFVASVAWWLYHNSRNGNGWDVAN